MKVACSIQSSLETHLARPLRIMLTASIACSLRRAVTSDPYPFASHVRFFTVRWSCSTRLLRYLHCRKRTRRGNVPSPFNVSAAAGKAGFLSTLMTRGTGLPGELKALRKKRLAASASRLAVSRKSIVLAGRIH
jgi:hypothetical protein